MEKVNYFNAIPWREALLQLGHCRFMDRSEFADGTNALKGKKIVIVGCGAQGLHHTLCGNLPSAKRDRAGKTL